MTERNTARNRGEDRRRARRLPTPERPENTSEATLEEELEWLETRREMWDKTDESNDKQPETPNGNTES